MATTRRRRSLRSVAHNNGPAKSSLTDQFIRTATGPTARVVYVAVGTAGLAALAIAIFGPRRFQRQIVRPVRSAVGDQAERLWTDSRPLREQIGRLFDRVQSESGRDKLVRSFQSWIGHFRAT